MGDHTREYDCGLVREGYTKSLDCSSFAWHLGFVEVESLNENALKRMHLQMGRRQESQGRLESSLT